jgi:hypothetical protein
MGNLQTNTEMSPGNEPVQDQGFDSLRTTDVLNTQFANQLLESSNRKFYGLLSGHNITVHNSVRSEFDASLRISSENLIDNLKYDMVHQERRATVLANYGTSTSETSIQQAFTAKFEAHLILMSNALASCLGNSQSTIQTGSERTTVIDSQHLQRAQTVLLGLSISCRDSNYSELIENIQDSFNAEALNQVYTRMVNAPHNSILAAMNVAATELATQGLNTVEHSQEVDIANILLLLNQDQKIQLLSFALSKINTDPDGSSKVILELVQTGALPVAVVENKLMQRIADEPDGSPQSILLTTLHSQLGSTAADFAQQSAVVQQRLADSAHMAGVDISNPALSGGKWAAFAAFYYGVLTAVANIGLGALRGDIVGGIAGAAPSAAVSTIAYQAFAGDATLEGIANRLANFMTMRRGQREELTENQWANAASEQVIQNQNIDTLSFFADPRIINLLRDSNDTNSELPSFSMHRFEERLITLNNPELTQAYQNYKSQFRSNNDRFTQNITLLASSLNALNITTTEQFADKLLQPYGIAITQLTQYE